MQTLETLYSLSLHAGNFTLVNSFDMKFECCTSPHHSLLRNKPFICRITTDRYSSAIFTDRNSLVFDGRLTETFLLPNPNFAYHSTLSFIISSISLDSLEDKALMNFAFGTLLPLQSTWTQSQKQTSQICPNTGSVVFELEWTTNT